MRLGILIAALLLVFAPTARAMPDCPDLGEPKVVLDGQGVLESVLVDSRGRLFFAGENALMVIDRRGAAPRVVAPVPKPGGLLEDRDGSIIAGSGNGFQEGAAGNVAGMAKLLRINPDTGEVKPFADGLSMANGLAWGPKREIFASDDAGTGIDRVVEGKVQPRWATVVSSNGLAVDAAGKYLYAAQTFQPAAVQRVEIANPANVTTFGTPPAEDFAAGLDGMTIDQFDRLYVTAQMASALWRFDADGTPCALGHGLALPSAVALGGTSAFVVTFSGVVAELENVRPAPPATHASSPAVRAPARLRATVRPARVFAMRRTRLRIQLRPAVADAGLRIAGRTVRTGARGRAVLRLRFRRAGRYALTYGGRRVAVVRVRRARAA